MQSPSAPSEERSKHTELQTQRTAPRLQLCKYPSLGTFPPGHHHLHTSQRRNYKSQHGDVRKHSGVVFNSASPDDALFSRDGSPSAGL